MPDKLKGEIERITFYNEDTGFGVVRLRSGKIITGTLPKLSEGDRVEAEGEWTVHPKFGSQLKVSKIVIMKPEGKLAILKYLSSGALKGLPKNSAKFIVDYFGEKALEIIDKDPQKLLKVPGISAKKLQRILESWNEQKNLHKLVIFLQNYDIPLTHANKILQKYGDKAETVILTNPYQLIFDIRGVGFKTADTIAQKIGLNHDFPPRIKSGVLYILENVANSDGHVYLPYDQLVTLCQKNLSVDLTSYEKQFNELIAERRILVVNDNVYLREVYESERIIETKILELSRPKHDDTTDFFKNFVHTLKHFSEEQLEAVRYSTENGFLVLTGGPGTGKTTTLKGIIDLYKKCKLKIALAAPTGRAAKRMTEVIGLEAKTIHRLLEYDSQTGKFVHNKSNPIKAHLLVIDEVSMINTFLMASLLYAVDSETTVVFVGDKDQLPAIGPGNILHDILEYNQIPIIRLNKIFRQAEQSRIITNSHRINQGLMPDLSNSKESDFFFMEEDDSNKIPDLLLDLVKNRLPAKYNFNPFTDIQILAPMYKGNAGVDAINSLLQEGLNEGKVIYTKGDVSFKLKDKFMQLVNDYERDIYNGDIGYLTGLDDEEEELIFNFGEREVKFSNSSLDDVTLAYACTIHKSQGSEYPCVIVVLTNEQYYMLKRNLIYTAITRAAELLIIVGSKRAVQLAVSNNAEQKRYTSLFKLPGQTETTLAPTYMF
ncbi:MAG: ATP-dependent RecD-like DNA helicase [Ignavibacteria bacterium]|nr:ATP-dependent RecD-like DNA helicase [Ignavibacteria bacterium]